MPLKTASRAWVWMIRHQLYYLKPCSYLKTVGLPVSSTKIFAYSSLFWLPVLGKQIGPMTGLNSMCLVSMTATSKYAFPFTYFGWTLISLMSTSNPRRLLAFAPRSISPTRKSQLKRCWCFSPDFFTLVEGCRLTSVQAAYVSVRQSNIKNYN